MARLIMSSIIVAVAIAALFIVTLLDAITAVLGEFFPPVVLFAQPFFVLRRHLVPAIDVSPDSFFFPRGQIEPVISRGRC